MPSPDPADHYEFTIPDCSSPRAIASYALHRLDIIIAALAGS